MTDIGAIGSSSAKIGGDLAELLTTPGLKQAELETQLDGLIQQQQQDVEQRAGASTSPGPLRPPHEHAIEALQLRVGGHAGPARHVQADEGDDSNDATAAGEQLADQARRLEASDVVWQDLFRVPAQQTLQDEGRQRRDGARRRCSSQNTELYSARSMTAIWQRIHGASTGGTPVGRARHGARDDGRAAGGHAALDRHRDDDQGLDRSRLRRLGEEQRREPGGADRGDADDPEGHDADREEADDRPASTSARRRRSPSRTSRRCRSGRRRRSRSASSRSPASRTRRTTAPSTRSSSRSSRWTRRSAVALAACVVAVLALVGSRRCLARRLRRCRAPRRRCSAARRTTWSTSPSRCRPGSTISTAPSTRWRPGSRGSTGASTAPITNTAVVRYDAYEDTGGQQSASFAFLDATRTGTVVTAIQGRDYARIYVKDSSVARPRWPSRRRSRRPSNGRWPADVVQNVGRRRTRGKSAASESTRTGTLASRATGSRPERKLRAAQRLLGPARARSRFQGQGRGRGAPRRAAPIGHAARSCGLS